MCKYNAWCTLEEQKHGKQHIYTSKARYQHSTWSQIKKEYILISNQPVSPKKEQKKSNLPYVYDL